MFFIVSYDTPSNKRRRKMSKIIAGFGTRVQKSVFETHLNSDQIDKLEEKLVSVIDEREDNLRIYQLPGDFIPKVRVWGKIPLVEETNLYYISLNTSKNRDNDCSVIKPLEVTEKPGKKPKKTNTKNKRDSIMDDPMYANMPEIEFVDLDFDDYV